ncbi:MAG: PKD domain-containing protein, partial [Actinobacteria bacterium]|nr:PKD domain-containing protein [Actinomycetota bacterium]
MKPTHASQPAGKRGAFGPRRPGVVVAIVAAIALIGALFTSVFAGAQPVGNPGGFNLKIEGGEIWIKDTDFDLTPNPLPACSDGEDNDEDGATDYPADAQCAGPDDNSEVAPGGQPKEDITIAGSIDANGAVNVPTSGIYFPPAYIEQGGDLLTARIQPTAAGTGSLNPMTGAATLSISLRIKLEGSPQGVSLGSSCIIGPFSLSLTTGTSGSLTGIGYNPDTGLATMVTNTFAVPAAGGCGPLGLANGPINDALGLPAAAGTSKATLLGSMTPIITRGVTASNVPSVSTGSAPLTVNFNGTGSAAVKPIASYAWDFGNGETATGATSFTTYSTPGTYDATLTVTDTDGTSHTVTKTITVTERPNDAPNAVIAASGTSGNAPYTLNVDGSASSDPDGSIVGYAWDFGNGQTATGATASVTYPNQGSYTVTLTVTDDKGATGTTTRQITVNPTPNVPPTAVIRTVSASGTIPLTVNLSATNSTDGDGSVVSYLWDLGNG